MKKFFKENLSALNKGVSALVLFSYAAVAMAAGAMPWEDPLCGLANALRGPTALAIATIAFFAAGGSFLWGEEIAGISKRLVTIFIGVCIMLGGVSLMGWIAAKMGVTASYCTM